MPHFALSHPVHAHEVATDTARRVRCLSVFIALGVHTLIDGVAPGAAVTGGADYALGGLVFVALISHHLPASFSLTSALKANQYPNSTSFFYLIIVNAVVPVGTVLAPLVLSGPSDALLGAVPGFSAGTFIHVATSGLLPAIQRRHRGKAMFFGVVVLGVLFMAASGMLVHPHQVDKQFPSFPLAPGLRPVSYPTRDGVLTPLVPTCLPCHLIPIGPL